MKCRIDIYWRILCTLIAATFTSTSAYAAETQQWVAANSWFIYIVIASILIGTFLIILVIRSALCTSNWSLSDALSEEVELTAYENSNGKKVPIRVATDAEKTLMVTEMRASSSRMIAMMGMLVILMLFLGFGTFALFSFAKTGNMPESINEVVNFLLSGLTLFAPYVVNKFTTVFESLSPKK